MKIDILTLFPEVIETYVQASVLGRAIKNEKIQISAHNLRNWAEGKHRQVDDKPYGGGAGMVLKIEPIYRAVKDLKRDGNTRVIVFSAKGRRYTQTDARRLKKFSQLILICGRYEGIDERVAEHIADEEISVGDFVLTGGELPALIVADSVCRLLPGVLGNEQSAEFESHSREGYLEHPHYTVPAEFEGWKVPTVLLSGHHGKIEKWRRDNAGRKKEE